MKAVAARQSRSRKTMVGESFPAAGDRRFRPFVRQGGLTLVELMVVVTIIAIILAIATMNFTRWSDKYTVESYTKHIHSILMEARNDAANSNTQQLVTLAANQAQVAQDTNGNGAVDAGEPTITSSYPRFTISSNIGGGLPSVIIFNRRGITSNIQTISITGYSLNASPGLDCIVLAKTRVNMGRMTGGVCDPQ